MTILQQYPSLASRYNLMMRRCYDQRNSNYRDYGGRGVTVCDEWKDPKTGREAYIKWALSIMSYDDMKGLQIDKDIGSAKLGIYPPVYSPETCTFVTKHENMQATERTRINNTSGYRGVHVSSSDKWCAEIRVNNKLIHLGHYTNPLDGAKAYDYFVKLNNYSHTINNVLEEGETVTNITKDGYNNPMKNTSKYFGVHFERSRNKWKAVISTKGIKPIFLGRFSTEDEAHSAVTTYLNKI